MAESNSTKRSPRFKDLTGQKFGRWTVLGFHSIYTSGNLLWLCRCECGVEKTVWGCRLKSGHTLSCRNCARKTHGKCRTPEYQAWTNMHGRCNSVNSQYHGGRGIKVCERWRAFENFLTDMGQKPFPEASIDRIDNDGNYSCGHCEECLRNGWPANCRWATDKEQQRNTRQNRMLTYNGKTMCLAEWGELLGIEYNILWARLNRGWSVAKTLSIPVRDWGRQSD